MQADIGVVLVRVAIVALLGLLIALVVIRLRLLLLGQLVPVHVLRPVIRVDRNALQRC